MSAVAVAAGRAPASSVLARSLRRWTAMSAVTLFALVLLAGFLMPAAYMAATAFKDKAQISQPGAPLWPASPETFSWQGSEYPIYVVPLPDGSSRRLALVEPHREDALFVDPANPDAGTILWVGRWRQLERAWQLDVRLENFSRAWGLVDFGRLLGNTFAIATIGTLGTLVASVCVAYGFSRFRLPGKNVLFVVLLSTIILPFQITLVPTFAVFSALGWVGTWLPLLVPHFFGNAYNIFLLRQYFQTIPRELDEAAMLDGAGPLRILLSVIVPQSIPAIVAVGLFHFFWAWNDYFLPLVYLQGNQALQPISVGIAQFNALYSQEPSLIQASAIMALAVPVLIFFLAQRAFMRGVVFSGVEK